MTKTVPTREARQAAKARRALDAITTLVEQSIIPDPGFYPHDLLGGLEYMRHKLFTDPDSDEAAAWWAAVGLQAQLNAGTDEPVTFTTSRPFIAIALDVRIETLGLSVADLFDGLAG